MKKKAFFQASLETVNSAWVDDGKADIIITLPKSMLEDLKKFGKKTEGKAVMTMVTLVEL